MAGSWPPPHLRWSFYQWAYFPTLPPSTNCPCWLSDTRCLERYSAIGRLPCRSFGSVLRCSWRGGALSTGGYLKPKRSITRCCGGLPKKTTVHSSVGQGQGYNCMNLPNHNFFDFSAGHLFPRFLYRKKISASATASYSEAIHFLTPDFLNHVIWRFA